MQALNEAAPALMDELEDEALTHFDDVQSLLRAHGIAFEINPRLVRGLDYYNRTVFEWVTDQLGAQGTVCAGGRYDGLIEQLAASRRRLRGLQWAWKDCWRWSKPVDVRLQRRGRMPISSTLATRRGYLPGRWRPRCAVPGFPRSCIVAGAVSNRR